MKFDPIELEVLVEEVNKHIELQLKKKKKSTRKISSPCCIFIMANINGQSILFYTFERGKPQCAPGDIKFTLALMLNLYHLSCDISSSSSQAAQADDPLKTADAMVSVTVEDINDNAPVFEKSEYSETVMENSPVGTVVLNVTVIDLDQVDYP